MIRYSKEVQQPQQSSAPDTGSYDPSLSLYDLQRPISTELPIRRCTCHPCPIQRETTGNHGAVRAPHSTTAPGKTLQGDMPHPGGADT